MNLHEYQSKRVFAEYGVPVPSGRVAATEAEAVAAARDLPGPVWVVKAQVHAGGRGKGGGIKLCRSAGEVGKAAKAMLGTRLVTPQTDAAGLPIDIVYVESGSAIERELYLSLLLDRETSHHAFIASAAGGMNIEEVAEKHPERILELAIKGMLPKSKLGKAMAKKLKVYADAEHRHIAQKPEAIEIG